MLLRLWKLIRNRTNREFLSWLGGGAVVIVAGAWTLFTYLHEDKKPTPSTTTTVIAPAGTGITSGRDTVVNAPVNIGLNEKQVGQQVTDAQKPLTEQLEKLAAQVARDKGVEVAPLRAILVKFGEASVRAEDIPERLDEKADELIRLREEIAKLRQGPAELAAYAQQAQTLIEKGDFDGARAALASGKAAAHGMREQSSRYEVGFLAQDAKINHLQLAYRSASTKYADAARLMETVDQRQQWEFRMAQARELYNQGNEFGDNPALVESIAIYRNGLLLAPRAQRSLDWARAQVGLGYALTVLGQRERGTARLERAVSAYREALQENTRARVPLMWARNQNNLGFALLRLGELENCRRMVPDEDRRRGDRGLSLHYRAQAAQPQARLPVDLSQAFIDRFVRNFVTQPS
jgi:exonuclease VII small subunit